LERIPKELHLLKFRKIFPETHHLPQIIRESGRFFLFGSFPVGFPSGSYRRGKFSSMADSMAAAKALPENAYNMRMTGHFRRGFQSEENASRSRLENTPASAA